MPIYRTVSDRGLWKKYQRSEQSGQPQHFHKPHYLDKEKPVVSHILDILKYYNIEKGEKDKFIGYIMYSVIASYTVECRN